MLKSVECTCFLFAYLFFPFSRAFSIVETVESMYALKYNVLEEWSVQQVVDCATKPNNGCEGGDTCLAIQWMNQVISFLLILVSHPLKFDL